MYHNIYKDKRCFIIGTGKSITKEILDRIKNEITIGVGGIGYAKELYGFEPTFIVSSDFLNFVDYYDALEPLSSTIITTDFVIWQAINVYRIRKVEPKISELLWESYYIKWKSPQIAPFDVKTVDDISFDLEEGTIMTGTVVQDLALPFAYWLGCNDVYLLGCDCDTKGHFYDTKEIKNGLREETFGYYKIYKEKFQLDNRNLINLSPSKITGFKNQKLETVLKNK